MRRRFLLLIAGLIVGDVPTYAAGISASVASGGTGSVTSGRHQPSADVCSHKPELFKVRRLSADTAMRLIRPAFEAPTITRFNSGYLVSGDCTKFIRTVSNGIILTNNARFGIKNLGFVRVSAADPRSGTQPNHFVPPRNLITIASNEFAEGHGRNYIRSSGFDGRYIALWSGPKGSVIGTIICTGDAADDPCKLDHLILSSTHRIRDFDFLPAPHAEMDTGSLGLWITVRPGEDAVAEYAIDYRNLYSQ